MWVGFTALGLIVLLAAAIGIMAFLGRRMPVNHTNTCVIRLPGVEPAAAWRTAYECESWPAWAGVDKVDILEPGPEPAWRMKMGRNSMLCRTRSPKEPESFEIQVEDERAKIFTGVWRYRFERDSAGGTRLTLVEDGAINMALPRFMARKLADPKMYMKRHLRLLARKYGVEQPEITDR